MGRNTRGPSGGRDGCTRVRAGRIDPIGRTVLGLVAFVCLLAGAAPAPAAVDRAAPPTMRFEVASDGSTVEVRWAVPPGQVVGFNVLRALREDGPYAPINPWLIPARADGVYDFADLAVDPGAIYHYQLEAVDSGGRKFLRGPLTIPVMPEESRLLEMPDGGGFPANGSQSVGTGPGGGCATADGGRWRDAPGLVLLLVLALVRWRGTGRRFPPRSPMR